MKLCSVLGINLCKQLEENTQQRQPALQVLPELHILMRGWLSTA
jgi:hypothetical protein